MKIYGDNYKNNNYNIGYRIRDEKLLLKAFKNPKLFNLVGP